MILAAATTAATTATTLAYARAADHALSQSPSSSPVHLRHTAAAAAAATTAGPAVRGADTTADVLVQGFDVPGGGVTALDLDFVANSALQIPTSTGSPAAPSVHAGGPMAAAMAAPPYTADAGGSRSVSPLTSENLALLTMDNNNEVSSHSAAVAATAAVATMPGGGVHHHQHPHHDQHHRHQYRKVVAPDAASEVSHLSATTATAHSKPAPIPALSAAAARDKQQHHHHRHRHERQWNVGTTSITTTTPSTPLATPINDAASIQSIRSEVTTSTRGRVTRKTTRARSPPRCPGIRTPQSSRRAAKPKTTTTAASFGAAAPSSSSSSFSSLGGGAFKSLYATERGRTKGRGQGDISKNGKGKEDKTPERPRWSNALVGSPSR